MDPGASQKIVDTSGVLGREGFMAPWSQLSVDTLGVWGQVSWAVRALGALWNQLNMDTSSVWGR